MNLNKIIILIFLILQIILPAHAKDINIIYFNPDLGHPASEIINISANYFKKANSNIVLQPVVNWKDISLLFKEQNAKYIIISPILIDIIKEKEKRKLILLPIKKNGDSTYIKKIIVKQGTINKLHDITDKIVASPKYGPLSNKILNDYILKGTKLSLDDIEIVWVKKDFDSILGLYFEQVDAAIISPLVYETLEKERPEYTSNLKVIHISKKIPLPCLFSIDSNENQETVENVFLRMPKSESGKKVLNLFGIIKWEKARK